MDILKSFKLLDKEYEVNIIGNIEEPLFQANHIANILELKRIHDSIIDFDDEEKVLRLTHTPGGIQNVIFLTEIGLYKLILRSRKPCANIFQKWVCKTIKEIRVNNSYKLKEDNEIEKNLIKYNYDIEKHKALIKAYDNKNVIYLCKFRYENNKILVKIGSSQNIKERMSNISNAYYNINPILIDLIEISNYKKFENYLHNHSFIKKFYYQIKNKENKISKETYLIDEIYISEIINIINNDKDKFIEISEDYLNKIKEIEELKLKKEELQISKINELKEMKLIDLDNNKNIIKFKEIEEKLINIEEKIKLNNYINKYEKNIFIDDIEEDLDNDIDLTKVFFQTKKNTYGIKIPYVYQYHPSDLINPIKIHESPADVERDKTLKSLEISPSPLRNAVKNNTIYKGFRWYYVKRNENPPESIPTTVENKHKEPEIKFIAMIDITKTKILAVYPNQKEATKARLMKANSFHRAIQNGSISSGHYWNYFDSCSEDMQQEYLKNNSLPDKYSRSISKKVEQICPLTKKVLKTYNSNREVIKNFKMSVSSLKKYSDSGEIHNGYIWKIV
jgi:prophage antirepressor-like protein